MRRQDWGLLGALAGIALAAAAVQRGNARLALAAGAVAVGGGLAAWGSRPSSRRPMPYQLRWLLRLPRGPHAPEHLIAVLRPEPRERILEIGGGIGVHAIPVAEALAGGELCTLDVQQPMLEALMDAAARARVTNITPALGDGQALPYEDATFDAAYLVSVLGEMPAPAVALAELRRVLKPCGRLVVGEMAVDPDFVPLRTMKRQADGAGLVFTGVSGWLLAYLARFEAPEASNDGSA